MLREMWVPVYVSQPQVSFLGMPQHRHIVRACVAQMVFFVVCLFFSYYFSHLFTSLSYREKIPCFTQCFAYVPGDKSVNPELWLLSFISLLLKNRCQSSLKGTLNSPSPPFPALQ